MIFKCRRYLNTVNTTCNSETTQFCLSAWSWGWEVPEGRRGCFVVIEGLACCAAFASQLRVEAPTLWYLVVPDLVKQIRLLTDSGGCFVTWIFSLLRSFNFAILCRISWGQTVYLINNHLETHTHVVHFSSPVRNINFHICQLSFCKVKREAALHLGMCRNATALPPRCGSGQSRQRWKAGGFTSTDDQRLFCRCPSRPRSFWSMCMKSRWSTSSRRIPCCTSTQSRWPRWCGCGNSWNHSERICSAAGPQWRRICGAGKVTDASPRRSFFLPARVRVSPSSTSCPTHFNFFWEPLSQLMQAKTNFTSQPSSRLWTHEWVPRALDLPCQDASVRELPQSYRPVPELS